MARWTNGRVQDSGSRSRSRPGFNTLPVSRLALPLNKTFQAALLLSTQEQMGTCDGRFVSHGDKLPVSGCIFPRELRSISRRIHKDFKGSMTREGTYQSLHTRALNLDADSRQCLQLYFTHQSYLCKLHRTPLYMLHNMNKVFFCSTMQLL